MKIVVCTKLTPDTADLDQVQPEAVGSEDMGVAMVLNAWDEFAVEEALQLQERFGGETLAISVGGPAATEALRRAAAMGIEEGILVSDPALAGSDAWGIAHALAETIKTVDDCRLILTGRQAVDGASGLVGAGLAVKLGVPFVSQVARVVDLSDRHVTVVRALDETRQTVKVALPAVLSVSKEINEPRYPSFVGIRKASRQQFPVLSAEQVPGLLRGQVGESGARVQWTDVRKPPARETRCQFIEGATPAEQAARLVQALVAQKAL